MNIENIAKYLIYTHAVCGGLALLAGILAILFKKGSSSHKKAGKVFFISLLISSILAIVITLIPSNYNPFLLSIGVFSLYLLLSGYRALSFKKLPKSLLIDKAISGGMLIAGVLMIGLPIISFGKLNIILAVFGGIGLFSAIRDFLLYRHPEKLTKNWLSLHLGNMLGAFIASVTAFVVVNDLIPGLFGWLGPTVLGTFYIVYWNIKVKKKKKKSLS